MKNHGRKLAFAPLVASLLVHGAILLVPQLSRPLPPEPKRPLGLVSAVRLGDGQRKPAKAPAEPKKKAPEPAKPVRTVPVPSKPVPPPKPAEERPAELFSGTAVDDFPEAERIESAGIGEAGGGTPALAEDDRDRLLAAYGEKLRGLIDVKKTYPYAAKVRNQEGSVKVCFTVDQEGRLVGEPVLEKKTRYSTLNQAALRAVKDAAPFPSFPKELRSEESRGFSITLGFTLN